MNITAYNDLHNIEIEKKIISDCLLNNDFIDELESKWFYTSSYKEIVQAMQGLKMQNKEVDILTIAEYLREKNKSISLSELTDLDNISFTTQGYYTHLSLLKELYNKREILTNISKIDYSKESTEILENLFTKLEKINNIDDKSISFIEQCDNYLKDKLSKNDFNFIKTGLRTFDTKNKGFKKGQLVTISAYTSMGKSALVSQLIINMLKYKTKIDLFTLEMSSNEIIDRICSNECDIPYAKLYTNNINEEEENKIIDYVGNKLATSNLNIYDDKPDIIHIIAQIRKDKRKNDIDIVYIDLINRVSCNSIATNRAEYLGEITRKLKLLAIELNICIVITAQINRVVESRQEKRPTLADIKESGGIAEDSDLVIGLYRNKLLDDEDNRVKAYNKGELDYNSHDADYNPNAIELLILKGRNLQLACYGYIWQGEYQRIRDWTR